MKDLEYNQIGIEPKQYLRYPSGIIKSVLVHILKNDDCPSCYEKDPMNFTDGRNVWRRVEFDMNNK